MFVDQKYLFGENEFSTENGLLAENYFGRKWVSGRKWSFAGKLFWS